MKKIELPPASEESEQVALCQWWRLAHPVYRVPEFALYAVPNGGWRHPATAARLKASGVRAGVSDLVLAVARGGFHGLYLEMKRSDGKPTASQSEFLAYVREAGYRSEIARGFEPARAIIVGYLKG